MDNIFDLPTDDVTIDQEVDYVEQYVGENKKFKDVAGLARGKAESDKYIDVLKKKYEELQRELNSRESVEAMITKIKTPAQEAQQSQQQAVTPAGQTQDDDSIEARLEALLNKREATRSSETNLQTVTRVMTEQFGPEATLVLAKKARDLGMTGSELQAIAQRNPQAFFKLTDISQEAPIPQGSSMPRSSVNSTAQQTVGGLKNDAYYQKMKRENPKQYFDPKTTVEQIKMAKELGDRYYS